MRTPPPFLWCESPKLATNATLLGFLDRTHLDTHSGRTHLNESSARHRDRLSKQHTINPRDEHPCSQRDSNPRSQNPSGCRPTP
jgi:hypothetical protein